MNRKMMKFYEPVGLSERELRRWRLNNGVCTICGGGYIDYKRSEDKCFRCLEKIELVTDAEVVKPRRKSAEEREKYLDHCIERANALGISYGEYMGLKDR